MFYSSTSGLCAKPVSNHIEIDLPSGVNTLNIIRKHKLFLLPVHIFIRVKNGGMRVDVADERSRLFWADSRTQPFCAELLGWYGNDILFGKIEGEPGDSCVGWMPT